MKIIFVFAHPDDETFSSGGTIAKLTKKGVIVKLVTATCGEAGSLGEPPLCSRKDLGYVREKELRKAAKVLGISQIYFLGFVDGTLNTSPIKKITQEILPILQNEKPDVVVTFDKKGGSHHPDHITVSKAATKAFIKFMKTQKKHVRLYHTSIPRSYAKAYQKVGLGNVGFGTIKGIADRQITTISDISGTFEVKMKAALCHKTQIKDWGRIIKRGDMVDIKKEFFKLVLENGIL